MQILRQHIPPHYFPVEQGDSVLHKVWRDLFLKLFHGRWGTTFERQIYWGVVLHGGLMIRSSCQGKRSSAWGSKWGLPWRLFVGLVVMGNYARCLVMFVIFMGFGGAEVRDALKSTGGWQCKPQEGGAISMGKGVGFSLYVILLYWNFVTGYCKRFYRIPPFPKFLLFHLFCIYWDWQGQKGKLECPKVYEIIL